MTDYKFRSLSVRLLALTAAWVSFVVGVIAYTMMLSWNAETSASALNQVSGIKVHFHRANMFAGEEVSAGAFRNELIAIERDLDSLQQITLLTPFLLVNRPQTEEDIAGVIRTWNENVLTHVVARQKNYERPEKSVFWNFVSALDQLRDSLEAQRERFLWQMRYLQILIMTLAIGSLFVILYLLKRWVIRPVNKLGEVFEQVSAGDLSARVHFKSHDEFGSIGEGFNRMAERLQDLYENLEGKVAEKTAAVQEKNRNLSQLYEMTTVLTQAATIDDMNDSFIEKIRSYTGSAACAVRLFDQQSGQLPVVASSGLSGLYLELQQQESEPDSPIMRAYRTPLPTRFDLRNAVYGSGQQLLSEGFLTSYGFHIRNGQNDIGLFEIFFKEAKDLPLPAFRQLQTFGTNLGIAVENIRLNERERQFAIVQERTFMAQGLHDSIAQTLSFLNMQVQQLESALKAGDSGMIDETVSLIKAGVQESYENVRELLLNFREKIHKEDFQTAILTVAKRFEKQSGVPVKVNFAGNGAALTEKEKLQITFIVQEALSNVRKHAKASHVFVNVDNRKDFRASVQDDGVGIDQELAAKRKARHVGLSIMEERAKKVGAEFSIDSEPGKGTTVSVILPEANRGKL